MLINGRPVGRLEKAAKGAISFQYAAGWLEWEHRFAVSLSLPLLPTTYRGAAVSAVFDNLLPDRGAVRRRIAERMGAQMAKIALPIDPDAAHCDRTAQRQQARPLPKSGQHGPASDSKAKDDCQPGPAFERARCEEVFHGAVHAGQGAQLVPKASALARRRIGCPTGPALPAKWGRFRVS